MILARRKAHFGDLTMGIFVFGVSIFCIQQFRYLYDLNSSGTTKPVTFFVKGVRFPGFSKTSPIVPEVYLSTRNANNITIITSSAFARSLVPGDTCLQASVRVGSQGFVFIRMHSIASSGDGTGSYMVAGQNRIACLKG